MSRMQHIGAAGAPRSPRPASRGGRLPPRPCVFRARPCVIPARRRRCGPESAGSAGRERGQGADSCTLRPPRPPRSTVTPASAGPHGQRTHGFGRRPRPGCRAIREPPVLRRTAHRYDCPMSDIETIASRDGTPLLARRWPEPAEPWATILVVHGIGEHSGRHEATGGRFAKAGLSATSFDHRGFGASGGRRAYVDHWSEFLDDIEDRLAASRRAGLPSAMYGHSLGGLLLADYLLDGRPLPDVAVLSAPALGANVNPVLRALAPILSRVAPKTTITNPWNPAAISREPMLPEVANPDPLSIGKTTFRLGAEIFAAQKRVARAPGRAQRLPAPRPPRPRRRRHPGPDRVIGLHGRLPVGRTARLPGCPPRAAPRSLRGRADRRRDGRMAPHPAGADGVGSSPEVASRSPAVSAAAEAGPAAPGSQSRSRH